jgi:hypothetical protein
MKTSRLPLLCLAATSFAFLLAPAHGALPAGEKLALRDYINALKAKAATTPDAVIQTANPLGFRALERSAVESEGVSTVEKLKKAVKADAEDDADRTFLRKHGFAINLGYGYYGDLKDYAQDVQVRYNFFQRQQTAAEVEDRVEKAVLSTPRTKKVFGEKLTDFSGWIGYPLEKLENRERTVGGGKVIAAGTVKEAPLVVGIGLGFGSGPEFSSAVSVNAGIALFRNEAFRRNQLYVGVSVDAVVFKAIIKAMADAGK